MISPIALVDMDGTVADYDTGISVNMELIRSPDEKGPTVFHGVKERQPDYYRNRIKMIRNQAGWWENLLTLPDGFQIVEMLKKLGFEIHVLTKGPKSSPNAYTEKVRWCLRHLPNTPICLTEKKQLIYGRVLVDDWPPYVAPWLEARPRGLVIMPDRPWNQGFEHPNLVRALVNRTPGDPGEGLLANPEEIFAALKLALRRRDGESTRTTCRNNDCNGPLRRWKQPKLLDDSFTDCRDHLPSISVRCTDCGAHYKRRAEYVLGGYISADDFCALQDKHGWPVPEGVFPLNVAIDA